MLGADGLNDAMSDIGLLASGPSREAAKALDCPDLIRGTLATF